MSNFRVVVQPGGGGGGAADWSTLTGKPPINTTVGSPGSDSNLVSEQAVRESVDALKPAGVAFHFPAPENQEYILSDDFPVAGTVTKATFKSRSGTVTAAVKIGITAITGLSALAITSTRASANATAANTIAQGNVLSVTFSAGATPIDVTMTLWITKS